MANSEEEQIRDRLSRLSGKDFQQIFWDILICQYPDLQTVKMQHDLGNDGYSIGEKCFFAVYAIESPKYDNAQTAKKISNPIPKNSEEIGDYEKFIKNWKDKYTFEKWIFVTKDNLMGKPHQQITELNNNDDGIKKEHWGLDKIVKLAVDLKEKDRKRIFNFINTSTQSTEIETIMDLICYITDNSELSEDHLNTMPDPDKKLERFSEYCDEIKSEIVSSSMYANAQKIAEQTIGLDTIRVRKKVLFLKQISRRFLRDNKDNPMVSLDQLTDYFENKLSESAKNFDRSAIRYYLIAEIPKCNIFPNTNE